MNAAFPKVENIGVSNGRDMVEITLDNGSMQVQIFNLGCIIHRIYAPDKHGKRADVVRGFDFFQAYQQPGPYYGALIGRCANRIANSRFTLSGKEYRLFANNGKNHLHGGKEGFDKKIWDYTLPGGNAVRFSYISEDGEEGYPGKLIVTATYDLTCDNKLRLIYEAQSDKDTLWNLTNHTYFNLTESGDIKNHVFQSPADAYCPVNQETLPTGEKKQVSGTGFDFQTEKTIAEGIASGDPQLAVMGGGYDHHFFVPGSGLREAATLYDMESGRAVTAYTTLPGFQLYTAQTIRSDGKDGQQNEPFCGICVETQYAPDAINLKAFEAPLLKAGERRRTETVYHFFVK